MSVAVNRAGRMAHGSGRGQQSRPGQGPGSGRGSSPASDPAWALEPAVSLEPDAVQGIGPLLSIGVLGIIGPAEQFELQHVLQAGLADAAGIREGAQPLAPGHQGLGVGRQSHRCWRSRSARNR